MGGIFAYVVEIFTFLCYNDYGFYVQIQKVGQIGARKRMIKKGTKILYYITVTVSMLIGLWHFFVPWMFRWYDYLPTQHENLIVGIDYTNYCFSLLLFGLSFMLLLLGRKALSLQKEVLSSIGQLIASDALAILMVITSISFTSALRRLP